MGGVGVVHDDVVMGVLEVQTGFALDWSGTRRPWGGEEFMRWRGMDVKDAGGGVRAARENDSVVTTFFDDDGAHVDAAGSSGRDGSRADRSAGKGSSAYSHGGARHTAASSKAESSRKETEQDEQETSVVLARFDRNVNGLDMISEALLDPDVFEWLMSSRKTPTPTKQNLADSVSFVFAQDRAFSHMKTEGIIVPHQKRGNWFQVSSYCTGWPHGVFWPALTRLRSVSDQKPLTVRGVISANLYPMRFIEFAWLSPKSLVASIGLVFEPVRFDMHCYVLEGEDDGYDQDGPVRDDSDGGCGLARELPSMVIEYQKGSQFIPCDACHRSGFKVCMCPGTSDGGLRAATRIFDTWSDWVSFFLSSQGRTSKFRARVFDLLDSRQAPVDIFDWKHQCMSNASPDRQKMQYLHFLLGDASRVRDFFTSAADLMSDFSKLAQARTDGNRDKRLFLTANDNEVRSYSTEGTTSSCKRRRTEALLQPNQKDSALNACGNNQLAGEMSGDLRIAAIEEIDDTAEDAPQGTYPAGISDVAVSIEETRNCGATSNAERAPRADTLMSFQAFCESLQDKDSFALRAIASQFSIHRAKLEMESRMRGFVVSPSASSSGSAPLPVLGSEATWQGIGSATIPRSRTPEMARRIQTPNGQYPSSHAIGGSPGIMTGPQVPSAHRFQPQSLHGKRQLYQSSHAQDTPRYIESRHGNQYPYPDEEQRMLPVMQQGSCVYEQQTEKPHVQGQQRLQPQQQQQQQPLEQSAHSKARWDANFQPLGGVALTPPGGNQNGDSARKASPCEDKPDEYRCRTCGKSFATSSNRTRHERSTHERKVIFECDKCPRTFTSKFNLDRHVSDIHLGVRKFTCPVCAEEFTRKSDWTKHEQVCRDVNPRV
ncbi:PR domain zinc finger protein 16 [Porphyridium purpureum]|uniref:PR domain zinc finger protein 16 n=1 Tax=Porphyridium purpureum TaxID=35688 RepID=A0A5J4YZN7_PORPP|nr:PR domain zinc finger protein 16 [Porphyridium purpureum]|eukprot:POR8323..scf209_3